MGDFAVGTVFDSFIHFKVSAALFAQKVEGAVAKHAVEVFLVYAIMAGEVVAGLVCIKSI